MEREYQWRAKVYGGLEVQKCKDTKEIKKVIFGSVDQWEMNRTVEAERCLMSIYTTNVRETNLERLLERAKS